MEECICVESRKYTGTGKLLLKTISLDCQFEFSFRNDGKSEFQCMSYLTNQNLISVLEMMQNHDVSYASFEGIDIHGGQIQAERLAVNKSTVKESSIKGIPNPNKYKISQELLTRLLSSLGKGAYVQLFLNSIFTIKLTLMLLSPVRIIYEEISNEDEITSISGLSNFEFGEISDELKIETSYQEFDVTINGITIIFNRKDNYQKIINQCSFNKNPDVTCETTIKSTLPNIQDAHSLLIDLCLLLSLSNSNWIIPIYNDIFKGKKVAQTTFYNHVTYPYVSGQFAIAPSQSNLVSFLKTCYSNLKMNKADFRINKVIEYHISGQSNTTSQEKFAVAYMALEVLCNKVEDFATKNNEKLIPMAIEETENKLKNVFERLGISVSVDQIKVIANKVAYKAITIKDAQKYLITKIGLSYDKGLTKRLYDIRNKLLHDYDSNYDELHSGITELADLLNRIILKLLGWGGQEYLSKKDGYIPVRLE